MKKGFTLIELLAVIVILAILALITIPIVMGIVENSWNEGRKRSIDMYGKAIENSVMNYRMINNKKIYGSFEVSDNGHTLTNSKGEILTVEYSGSNVVCSTVRIYKDETVYLEGCKVGEDEVLVEDYVYGVKEVPNKICTAATSSTLGNVPSGNFIAGDEYTCEVSEGVTYNFYVINTNGNNVNLIMDRDIAVDQWYGYGTDNSKYGPVDAMQTLYNSTKTWDYIPAISINYTDEGNNYATITSTNGVATITSSSSTTTTIGTTKTPLRARLITVSEASSNLSSNWLFSNIGTSGGYWTLSSYSELDVAAVFIRSEGTNKDLYADGTGTYDGKGIRPVITVAKSSMQ